jgi:hypothetical protein
MSEDLYVVRQPSKGNKIKAVFYLHEEQEAKETAEMFGMTLSKENTSTWSQAERNYWLILVRENEKKEEDDE